MHLPRSWRAFLTTSFLAALVLVGAVTAPLPASAADAGVPVVSRGSGRCLGVDGGQDDPGSPGSTLSIQTCNGRAGQAWTYAATGSAAGTLRVFGGTRCLDAGGGVDGARLVIQPCSGGRSQQVLSRASGSLELPLVGLCVVVHHAVSAAGTPVEVGSCSGTTSTLWRSSTLTADTVPPTAPADVAVSGLGCRSVTLSWSPAQDGGSAARWYDVYHDGQLLQSVAGTPGRASLAVIVIPGVTWGLYVNARDAAGNVGPASATVSVTPPACAPDTTPPTAPHDVTTQVVGGTGVRVRWKPSTDANGVPYYIVQRDGATVGRLTGTATVAPETTFLDSGLAAGSTHTYRVVARDPQLNTSAFSAAATATVGSGCLVCSVREVAHDSDLPWGLTPLPDGTVLYGRRDAAQLVRLDPTSGRQTGVGAVPGVTGTDGEGGLLGLAVATTFATDRWVYVMHSTATDLRVVRIRLVGSTLDAASVQVLLTGIPRNKYHDGGRLRFGPDGKLYVATGDGQNQSSAQDLSVLGGKILRLDPDGGVPADNPFGTYVWSFGHRNPQGLAFDSKGRLWEQEFGNSRMDETNLVVKGGNYGWPACEGTVGRCSPSWFIAPKRTYQVHVGSCSGLAVVRDVLYVACLRGTRLYREVISGTSLTSTAAYLEGTYGRLRTVEPDLGGKGLWLTTSTAGDKDSVPGNSAETILHVGLNGTPG